MAGRPLFVTSSLSILILFFSFASLGSSSYEKVEVSLYYEALCPFCANFVTNQLVKIFQNGLISAVNLRLIPWGNAWISPNSSVVCQHGTDECLLNTIEACTINVYPDVNQHFKFIHCVERLTLEGKHNEWTNCFEIAKLSRSPIDCYNSGYGKQIEERYAKETAQLNPPHRFVPWVIVNGKPLQEDYQNFMAYICKSYRGKTKPSACRSVKSEESGSFQKMEATLQPQVCYVESHTLHP